MAFTELEKWPIFGNFRSKGSKVIRSISILLFAASLGCAKESKEPEAKSLGVAYGWVFATAVAAAAPTLLLIGRDTYSESYDNIQAFNFIFIPIGWSVAPSMGRFYAGDYKGGLSGTGLRLGALAAAVAVIAPCVYGGCNEALAVVPLAATGIWVGSAVYDTFWGTYHSVQKHNAKICLIPFMPHIGSIGVLARFDI